MSASSFLFACTMVYHIDNTKINLEDLRKSSELLDFNVNVVSHTIMTDCRVHGHLEEGLWEDIPSFTEFWHSLLN